MATLTQTESDARDLLNEARKNHWTPTVAAVCNTFEACYASALSVERVKTIAEALCHTSVSDEALRTALTTLVRAKILRSRMIRGERHYEINY